MAKVDATANDLPKVIDVKVRERERERERERYVKHTHTHTHINTGRAFRRCCSSGATALPLRRTRAGGLLDCVSLCREADRCQGEISQSSFPQKVSSGAAGGERARLQTHYHRRACRAAGQGNHCLFPDPNPGTLGRGWYHYYWPVVDSDDHCSALHRLHFPRHCLSWRLASAPSPENQKGVTGTPCSTCAYVYLRRQGKARM